MRKFEKISFEQFTKDVKNDSNIYEHYLLPIRSTKHSAGYDIKALENFVLKPGETRKVATGIKVSMESDEVFMVYVRSSMGINYSIRLMNGVGVIDADYYNNVSNEGHLFIALKNDGEKEFVASAGDAIAQGIFMKYLTVEDEETIDLTRTGGFGSTNKEEQ